MSDKIEFTTLDINIKNLVKMDDSDITLDELRLTTNDAMGDLTDEQLSDLKDRYKKITYTILDTEKNRRGFGLTEDALKGFVDHFNQTKDDSDLHGFFKDHDYRHIDSLMGRIVNTWYDPKKKRVRRSSLIDMRHPTAKRLDMFKNLSTSLLHGQAICSTCGEKYISKTTPGCSHIPDGENHFPRSTIAVGIEDSLVTISGQPNAKRDSLNVFRDSLSTSAPELMQEFEDELERAEDEGNEEEEEDEKDKEIDESQEDEIEDKGSEDAEKPDSEEEEDPAISEKELREIKESINILKKIIERQS